MGEIVGFIKTFFSVTWPPMDTDPRRRSWEISATLAIYCLLFVALWGSGVFPKQFGQGYALAADVADRIQDQTNQLKQQNWQLQRTQKALADIQAGALKANIRDNEIMRCRILADKRSDADLRARALDGVNKAIDDGTSSYFQLTRQVYQQQTCEVLLIAVGKGG